MRLNDTQNADIGGASVLTDNSADIHRAVYQFEHPQTVRQPTAHLPKQRKAHSKKFKPQMKPSKVKVLALNGTDRSKLATKAAAGFQAWTYNARAANAPNPRYKRTWIYYQPGYKEAAADLHKVLGAGYSLPVPSRFASRKANVIVVLGADAPGKPALSPPHKPVVKLPSDMVRSTDYRAPFAAAAHRAHLPGLYPSAVFGTSEQCVRPALPVLPAERLLRVQRRPAGARLPPERQLGRRRSPTRSTATSRSRLAATGGSRRRTSPTLRSCRVRMRRGYLTDAAGSTTTTAPTST